MESIHHLLMKAHTCVNRDIMAEASALGLTPGRPKVLECLFLNGENNQKAIAGYCEIEQATVGNILLGMEKDGLIVRKQKDGNRRSLYVSLTDKGMEMAKKVMEIFDMEEEKLADKLTKKEEEQLIKLLEKICEK